MNHSDMPINLFRVGDESAEVIWRMQVEAFSKLYEKYQDTDTNPAAEPVEKILARLQQHFTYYYLIQYDTETVGAIRIVDKKEFGEYKRISPIFILPSYQNRGIAQKAILKAEQIHGSENWALETIAEEPGLCRLYEKLGYYATGKTEKINERLTLVYYQK